MKNTLIIGGSTDIGISLAKKLVLHGFNVVSTYYQNKFTIPNVLTYKCDVKNKKDLEDIINLCKNKFNDNFILINLANICLDDRILNKSKEEFMKVLEVNLVGTFLSNQIYSKNISNGLIINIASSDGIDTFYEYGIDYAVSQAGIIHLSKCLDKFTNNKVYCICPNWIDSDTTRLMEKEYLDSELKRIGQSRLIKIDELNKCIYDIILNYKEDKDNLSKIIKIDIKDDKLWIERI